MTYWQLLIFIVIWGVTDRIREIAVFPGWKSIFGEWFDRYFTPECPYWNPFRDGYHTFKIIPVLYITCIIYINNTWQHAFLILLIWAVSQGMGLIFKKEKYHG